MRFRARIGNRYLKGHAEYAHLDGIVLEFTLYDLLGGDNLNDTQRCILRCWLCGNNEPEIKK